MMEIRGLRFRYGIHSPWVLDGVSLSLRAGEIGIVLGRNGSGKTTLFKNLLGICRPQEGTVSFDGQDLLTMRRRERAACIAYVPQDIRFGALTVYDTVLLGRVSRFGFRAGEKDREVTAHILEQGKGVLPGRGNSRWIVSP